MELNRGGAPRSADGRFRNHHPRPLHGHTLLFAFLREMRRRPFSLPAFEKAGNDPDGLAANRHLTSCTWIGHASFLVQLGGLNILTDPVLSPRISPLPWIGPRRIAPLGLDFDELPRIDVVLISHNHYDHLDDASVRRIAARDAPAFVVPRGLGTWFARRGIHAVSELDWWQSTTVHGLRVHGVPAQHFSGRGLRDRNRSLWCGYVYEKDGQRHYFAGDTGYGPDFVAIGARFAPIDLSMIPIGAYDPRDFMQAVHVNPEEAVRIHQDVGSRLSLAMHWGTFRLTLEPLEEPPHRLAQALAAAGIAPAHFRVLAHGQTLLPATA